MSDTYTFSTTRPLFGQVAIVTGASRGIGKSIAIALAKSGASVVINYKTSSVLAQEVANTCKSYGAKAIAVQADVTQEKDVLHLVEVTATELGQPSILVNNAGVAHAQLLSETSLEAWNRLIQSNMTASFLCVKQVLPDMIRQGYGRIINISSIWGISGGSYEVAYSASKGGLIAFTKALAKEVGKSGVTVNAVAPGAIETDMLQDLSQDDRRLLEDETPVGRIGSPEDVSHCVLFLASPAASYVTGQVISPNGGLVI
jgi:3-oxoacyl-[acyl-carrier protein] reductase